MTTHKFQPKKYYTAFGSYEPALKVVDGDTVVTSTADNAGRDLTDKQVTFGPNPLTGPFYVEGAEPGDTLAVQSDRLWPNRQLGRSATVVASNAVDPYYVSELPPKQPRVTAEWKLNLDKGTATLLSPETKLEPACFALEPHVRMHRRGARRRASHIVHDFWTIRGQHGLQRINVRSDRVFACLSFPVDFSSSETGTPFRETEKLWERESRFPLTQNLHSNY